MRGFTALVLLVFLFLVIFFQEANAASGVTMAVKF
jgi:hypothetical protein